MSDEMLTELEQRANAEARHAHRELVEVELRNMARDYLVAAGQAAEAYQAQLAAEAKFSKAVEALGNLVDIVENSDTWVAQTISQHDAVTTLAELKGDSQ